MCSICFANSGGASSLIRDLTRRRSHFLQNRETEKTIVYMKFLFVTYPDPEAGHPTKYVRDSIPEIKKYPGGATAPTPEAISFKPGELLGDETGAFGIKSWLENLGHEVVSHDRQRRPQLRIRERIGGC
jgi:hypothetical protein